jgi:HlyD family secretion protein
VTYPVLIDVNNPDLLLKPGMTANVNIPVETRKDVLKVPNAALRFQPAPEEVGDRPSRQGKFQKRQGSTIYTLDLNGKLKPVSVTASITDGAFTAIQSSALKEGDDVIVGFSTSRAMESSGGMQQRSRRGGGRPF